MRRLKGRVISVALEVVFGVMAKVTAALGLTDHPWTLAEWLALHAIIRAI